MNNLYGAEKVTVEQLIEALRACPPKAKIKIYYDGSPRRIPNACYQHESESGLVVLGEKSDIYDPESPSWLFVIPNEESDL